MTATAAEVRPLLVSSSYAPHLGGVEEVVRQLAHGLATDAGSQVVVTNRWPKNLPGEEAEGAVTIIRRRFRTPDGGSRQLAAWSLGAPITKRAIRRHARKRSCNVVNVHCVSSNVEYVLDVSEALHLPIVVSLHGELTADATGAYERPRLRALWADLIDRAAAITAPSEYVLRRAEEAYGQKLGMRATVIRNGVDRPQLPDPAPMRSGVLAAGRFVGVKGFDLLLHAWATLGRAVTRDERLVIAGEGPEFQALKDLSVRLGVDSSVEFPGRLDRTEMQQRMGCSRAVVIPSREEALGLVALEAMALETPVVATAVGGLPEIVVDGRTGILVPPENPAALGDAIREVLGGGRDLAALAERGRELTTDLSWPNYVRRMRSCMSGVVMSSRW